MIWMEVWMPEPWILRHNRENAIVMTDIWHCF